MLVLVLVLLGCASVFGAENNVCPTFKDYYTIKNNSNCWYDLAAENDVPGIISLYGYPLLEYHIPTKDGFVLTMFRIPSDNRNPHAKRYPVYLQHGLIATCANFLALGKNSLAFVLADAGFDVWLGNYRATQYSEAHLNLTVFDNEYWEHSMDEIVSYDLPAIFSTILGNSEPGSQIIFLGHSLGTTLGLMYAAEFPEVAKTHIKLFVMVSPAYTLSNMRSPYKMMVPLMNGMTNAIRKLEMFRILSQAEPLRRSVRTMCLESPPLMQFCMQLYNLFYGPNTQLGPETIPVYFNQLPGGTAFKVLNHAADLVLGNFRKYDYFEGNLKRYGTPSPPVYDIKKVAVPVYLMYSTQDWATTEADSLNLWHKLPESSRFGIKRVNLPNFNHMDFVFGRRVRSIVYDDLIKLLNKVVVTYLLLLDFYYSTHRPTSVT